MAWFLSEEPVLWILEAAQHAMKAGTATKRLNHHDWRDQMFPYRIVAVVPNYPRIRIGFLDMRQDEILQELVARLASMGIEPLGALERTPSLVEYREWGTDARQFSSDATANAIEAAIATTAQTKN